MNGAAPDPFAVLMASLATQNPAMLSYLMKASMTSAYLLNWKAFQ